MEVVTALAVRKRWSWSTICRISNLHFANDIDLLTESADDLQFLISYVNETLERLSASYFYQLCRSLWNYTTRFLHLGFNWFRLRDHGHGPIWLSRTTAMLVLPQTVTRFVSSTEDGFDLVGLLAHGWKLTDNSYTSHRLY